MFHLKPKPSPPAFAGCETPPGCRFFRDRHAAGEQAVGLLVRALQEADRIAVFIAAVGIGQPLAGLSRIIEIEHGGHRIHAQAVDVEAVEPIERAGAEEIGNFPAAEIVNGRVPVRVEAAARIGMLVKRGAVEIAEAMLVGRKMRGHPIEDHAEASLMGAVYEALEPGRVAVTPRRREQADGLVAPGRIERMLRDGHQLDMSEAHPGRIRHKLIGEVVVAQELVVVLAPPGAQMHLVDAHRPVARIGAAALGHVDTIVPLEPIGPCHDRGRGRPHLAGKTHRIGLERKQPAARPEDFVFIGRALAHAGREDFPQAAVDTLAHLVPAAVPMIEIANNRHAPRLRRPDCKQYAVHAFMADGMGAQALVELAVRSLD